PPRLGLTDRGLAVLQAMISFTTATILGGNDPTPLVVHPSNKAICERLNGIPCSTMRRHLANLVQSGFLIRRDSPNGKRYVQRTGGDKTAFGFDLTPLVARFAEVCAAAEDVRAEQEHLQRLRTAVSLMRRDLAGLAEYGRTVRPELGFWDECEDVVILTARDLRRKPEAGFLGQKQAQLEALLDRVRDVLDHRKTQNTSTNDIESEQHHQNSNTDSYDSELCKENAKGAGGAVTITQGLNAKPEDSQTLTATSEPDDDPGGPPDDANLPNVPIGLVLASCHEFKAYVDGPVRHWHHLVAAADLIRPMMGISPSAWEEAKLTMGPEEAAVVVVAMLERFGEIKSPGGYLRALTDKAALGAFSCGPMIVALMRKDAA
ncbi:MAG: plasmid replication protein RepC, partial [Paracoccaceae bacterium]